jgi:hypothetical protein
VPRLCLKFGFWIVPPRDWIVSQYFKFYLSLSLFHRCPQATIDASQRFIGISDPHTRLVTIFKNSWDPLLELVSSTYNCRFLTYDYLHAFLCFESHSIWQKTLQTTSTVKLKSAASYSQQKVHIFFHMSTQIYINCNDVLLEGLIFISLLLICYNFVYLLFIGLQSICFVIS